jgi:hypothetical protein
MSKLEIVEREALSLSSSERAALVVHLLDSLPAGADDLDGGLAEAHGRDLEMDRSNIGISWDEVRQSLGR